jgi:hypothetical protein
MPVVHEITTYSHSQRHMSLRVAALQIYVLHKDLLTGEKNKQRIFDPPTSSQGTAHKAHHKRGSEKGGLRWSDIHNQTLIILVGATTCPSGSCVNLHATSAIQHAEESGWNEAGEVAVPSEGWATTGYDDLLMAKLLGSPEGGPVAPVADAGEERLQYPGAVLWNQVMTKAQPE